MALDYGFDLDTDSLDQHCWYADMYHTEVRCFSLLETREMSRSSAKASRRPAELG